MLSMAKPPLFNQVDDGESICSSHSILLQDAKSEPKKKLKSGMYDKVADEVILKLKWPHKRLSRVWVPERVQPNQLTFEQVVAGEIAIVLHSSNPDEVRARLQVLQKNCLLEHARSRLAQST